MIVFRRGRLGAFVRGRHLANDLEVGLSYGERDGNVEQLLQWLVGDTAAGDGNRRRRKGSGVGKV
jgi:hypothetical protein